MTTVIFIWEKNGVSREKKQLAWIFIILIITCSYILWLIPLDSQNYSVNGDDTRGSERLRDFLKVVP